KYVLGLTATPYRRDGHQPIIHMQCGPIVYQIKQKDVFAHIASSIIIERQTGFTYPWTEESKIVELSNRMVESDDRNKLIADDVINVINEGRFPLILTERREHLEKLAQLLQDKIKFLA